MKNLFVPFAVAILGEAAMAVTMPSDLSDNINDDFLMLAEQDRTGKCEERANDLADDLCDDGDASCVEEITGMCGIWDRCTRWSKMDFWAETKKCSNAVNPDNCREWVRSEWKRDRKYCNLTCQQLTIEECGKWADAKDDPATLAEWARCTALKLRETRQC